MTVFVSCEGGTDYYYEVLNSSSTEIVVDSIPGYDTMYSYTIQPNSRKEIYFFSKLGGSSTRSSKEIFMDVIVHNTNGDTLSKPIWADSNWLATIKELSRVPSGWRHDYLFVVSDSDF